MTCLVHLLRVLICRDHATSCGADMQLVGISCLQLPLFQSPSWRPEHEHPKSSVRIETAFLLSPAVLSKLSQNLEIWLSCLWGQLARSLLLVSVRLYLNGSSAGLYLHCLKPVEWFDGVVSSSCTAVPLTQCKRQLLGSRECFSYEFRRLLGTVWEAAAAARSFTEVLWVW